MKNKLLKLMAFILMISIFIPLNVIAEGDESQIIRKTTTNYFTTVRLEGTFTNEYTGETENYNMESEETAGNITDEVVAGIISNYKQTFNTWAESKQADTKEVKEEGITNYYYEVHDEITQENNISGDVIQVGDLNDLDLAYQNQGQITINTILNKHQTYVIRMTAVKIDKRIKEININVTLPYVGDEITAEDDDWNTQKPQATITLPNGVHYELYGSDDDNYMYYMETGSTDHKPFKGKFQKGKNYTMEIWFKSIDDFYFTENTKIIINGEEVEYDDFDDGFLSVLYDFEPQVRQIEYNLTNEDASATATFTYEEGFDFKLKFIDILTLTKEQREAMDISDEVYNQALEQIKNNVKKYGTLLGVYSVEIEAPNRGYHDSVKIKVKLTDEMKKYNKFQFIYLDDENNFKVGEIVDFKIEGDYLVGTLPHLSAWALVGNKVNNPQTGDNILGYVILLGISIVGLVAIKKSKKEN